MPKEAQFYATFNLPQRDSLDEASADFDRLVAILREHAPDLLPASQRPVRQVPGGEAMRRVIP